jgi:hypothetical protein
MLHHSTYILNSFFTQALKRLMLSGRFAAKTNTGKNATVTTVISPEGGSGTIKGNGRALSFPDLEPSILTLAGFFSLQNCSAAAAAEGKNWP